MSEKMKTFEELYQIDVSERIEKKGDLSYLSWAWAWAEMKKVDANAKVIVHEFPHYENVGDQVVEIVKPYLQDKGGAMVKVSVTINGHTETEWLPVMDNRNKSITEPTSMDINTAHKRCFVKALALHGLGLYIYAGEDLPEPPKAEPISDVDVGVVEALLSKLPDARRQSFLKKYKIKSPKELTTSNLGKALEDIKKVIELENDKAN